MLYLSKKENKTKKAKKKQNLTYSNNDKCQYLLFLKTWSELFFLA